MTLIGLLIAFNSILLSPPEEIAIKEVVSDYIEGWYSTDTVRMAKALSPELVKRGFYYRPQKK